MNNNSFKLDECLEIIESTPDILIALTKNKSTNWTNFNEGINTWSTYQIVEHLIEAEKTNWIPRIKIILSTDLNKTYHRFERLKKSNNQQPIELLCEIFKKMRNESLIFLKSQNLKHDDFLKEAIHPEFGKVTLVQQISTWAVHDLSHLSQISRVMAFQYKEQIGPWSKYFNNLNVPH
ncbi:DinB family protein [uncultured Polaribacter sp.]|uniref:DinB family protein n=1 Tax=uncultured Polaribacter sp. TaxID=174711 RepID=UPI0026237AAE|nr:DinB family protein [uncultured Polaribacter sp.]